MIDLFVYGSLMFESVRDAIISNRYQQMDARVAGYKRICVKRETYPALVASPGDCVAGVILLGIGKTDMDLLDTFEGEYYCRKTSTCNGGAMLSYAFNV